GRHAAGSRALDTEGRRARERRARRGRARVLRPRARAAPPASRGLELPGAGSRTVGPIHRGAAVLRAGARARPALRARAVQQSRGGGGAGPPRGRDTVVPGLLELRSALSTGADRPREGAARGAEARGGTASQVRGGGGAAGGPAAVAYRAGTTRSAISFWPRRIEHQS